MKPEYRKYDYIVEKGTEFELLRKVLVPTGREVIKIENTIHEKFDEYNLDKNYMRKYLTESGFTECYPVEILDRLNAELDEVEKKYEK
jgi:hypothetical protein